MKMYTCKKCLDCVFIFLGSTLLFVSSCSLPDFELEEKMSHRIRAVQDDKTITLLIDDKKVLSYHLAVHDVPEGVDLLYRRSGFIHPIWSPGGKVLTINGRQCIISVYLIEGIRVIVLQEL